MVTTPCERWAGPHRKSDGRPLDGKRYAYRARWIRERGPLSRSLILHHECENKWCINLEHLKPITQGQHLHEHGLPGDWGQREKTHCPAGHEYNSENTYYYTRKGGSMERHCKFCQAATKLRYRDRIAAKKMGWA